MKEIILEKLKQIEKNHNITVLYAVESGSRAWGYANESSDYDIRYVYRKNNLEDYLVLNYPRDVIEYNDGLYDMVGWDIKKVLYLHYNNNPNLREWIISEDVYIEDTMDIFKDLPEFNLQGLKYHYLGLANNTYKKYIRNYEIINEKLYKRMLYATRCILIWKQLEKGIYPPINLHQLLEKTELSEKLENSINKLYQAYSQLNSNLIDKNTMEYLFCWIIDSINYMKEDKGKVERKKDINIYNKRFQEILLGRR